MEANKLAAWIQIVGNLSVLAGLVFVGLQLNQDRDLKRAELVWDGYSRAIENTRAELGENPAESIERLLLSPGELTNYDITVLNSMLRLQMIALVSGSQMERYGIFREEMWRRHFLTFSNTPLGRRWWIRALENNESLVPEYRDQLLRGLREQPPEELSGLEYYEFLRGEEYPEPTSVENDA